jgi:hypothetical protein
MRTELLKSQLEALVLGFPSPANINHLGRRRRNQILRLCGTEYAGRTPTARLVQDQRQRIGGSKAGDLEALDRKEEAQVVTAGPS